MPNRISIDTTEKIIPQENPSPSLNSNTDNELKSASNTGSSFCAFPASFSFVEKQDDEDIILLLRAHPATNAPWILATFIGSLVPLIALPLLNALGSISTGIGSSFVITLIWLSGIFTYAFLNFLYWYFNVYIVTNERIIDVDWYSVIYRKISHTRISKIQDISYTQAGVFAGIFDYGTIEIQTAGEEENFEFTAVPHPRLITKKIEELMEEEEKEWEEKPNG